MEEIKGSASSPKDEVSDNTSDIKNQTATSTSSPFFYRVFAEKQIQENGILLYRKGNDNSLTGGSVYFHTNDIPEGSAFATEDGLVFERKSSDLFWFAHSNETFPIDELEILANEHYEKYQELKKQQEIEARIKKEQQIKELQGAQSFDELPEDLKKAILKSDIAVEALKNNQNWEIVLNILRFAEKRDLRTPKMRHQYHLKTHAPNEVIEKLRQQAEALVVANDKAKKYFKSPEFTGEGGFGSVFFAEQTYPTRNIVAIKKMTHTTEKERKSNLLEVGFLSSCIHPNIVRFLSCYKIKEEIWIVTEFMSGGTLQNANKYPFREKEIAYICREVLKALEFLHYRGFVHRDLKSSNVMLTLAGDVKLIDLGLCYDASTGPLYTMCGSALWMSPEMISNKPHSYPVDIWSFGITVLEMTNGDPPSYGNKIKSLYRVATEGSDISFKEPLKWSSELKDFISCCLKMDPNERKTATDLLNHPFIRTAETRDEMQKIIRSIFLSNTLVELGMFA